MKSLWNYKYFFFAFLAIGILTYFPIFSNGFVWDDFDLLITNPQFHTLDYSIFYGNILNTGYIYRQVIVLYYAVLYAFFGQNALPYHIFQIGLHILATSLVFVLFRHYFKTVIAFIISLFFLIHPINAETVLWISSVQTIIYTIFGISALLIVHKDRLSKERIILLGVSLSFCILSYEMGIFYFLLVLYYVYTHKPSDFKKVLTMVFLILALYVVLRFVGYALDFTLIAGDQYTIQPTFVQKLYAIPSVIFYYFKTLLFPVTLIIWQTWIIKEMSFWGVLFPGVIFIAGFVAYLFFVVRTYAKSKKTLYFFSLWFFIGFFSLLHIFPPLEMTVADRWFYFPFIGLLGILGFLIQKHKKYFIKHRTLFISLLIIIFCLYSVRTFYRSFDWKKEFTLYTHDLQLAPDNVGLNYNVGLAYAQQKKYKEAIPYFEKACSNTRGFVYGLAALGAAYEGLGDFDKASFYYKQALYESKTPVLDTSFDLYYALANSLMKTKKYHELQMLLTDSIMRNSPHAVNLYVLRAEVNYELKNYEDALKDAEFIYTYTDYPKKRELYNRIKQVQFGDNKLL